MRRVVALFAAVLAVAACSSSDKHAAPLPTTTTFPLAPIPFAGEMSYLAQNTVGSLIRAMKNAEPDSPAEQFFAARESTLQAFVATGGFGAAIRLSRQSGRMKLCATINAKQTCDVYSRPVYAGDGKLANFELDDVAVDKVLRTPGVGFMPSSRRKPTSGLFVRIATVVELAPQDLQVVLSIDNESIRSFPMTDTRFLYSRDGATKTAAYRSHAWPSVLAPGSKSLASLRFTGTNLGGDLTVRIVDEPLTFRIPGPPAPAFNIPGTDTA